MGGGGWGQEEGVHAMVNVLACMGGEWCVSVCGGGALEDSEENPIFFVAVVNLVINGHFF